MAKNGKVFVRDFAGLKIYYNRHSKYFLAIDKDDKEISKHRDEEQLQENLKRWQRQKRKFKPFEAIQVEYHRIVRITSRAADEREDCVWISFKDESDHWSRSRELLESGAWRDEPKNNFVKKTRENELILAKILDRRDKIGKLSMEIEALQKKYRAPVTLEMLELEEES